MRALQGWFVLAAASVTSLLTVTGFAQAGAFGIRENSAQAQGMSFAGAAAGSGGLSSAFWNPATITMRPGWNSEFDATLIIPNSDITPLPPTPTLGLGPSGEIGQDAVVPASYTSYQVNDRLWLGFASTAPFGLVTKPNQVWAGQVYARSSRIFSLDFSPIVAIKLTDWLSIAAGPDIQYFRLKLRAATGVAPTAPSGFQKADDWGIGFNAGATITPFAGTQIGIGYRSSVNHELEGSAFGIGPIKTTLNTPDKLSVGLTQAITPVFRLNLGFEWDNWSRLGTPAIVSSVRGVPVAPFPLNYEDGFMYSIGGEYDWSDRWTVRAGFAYEESPINTRNRSPRLPDSDRYWASVGASYRWNEKITFDVAYSHLFFRDARIALVPGNPLFALAGLPFVADSDTSVNIVSVGLKYRWDNPKVAEPAPAVRPIVRKY